MFKLARLEISGFKSFPDTVAVDFGSGITAIVGPNGCGKSNLSEAMTWVLGEQSAKSLRGGKMEDFIFNGSQQRKPLGLAEAALTLATVPTFPRAEDGRVTLSRRVFRSGESQYRLNGKVVRMKEIRDLLMDTGLGIRAYSVIEQGKIGMILSGKPQERRRLIEEAAGITRYRARKRIAELKLEEATANLVRLDDILGELERSLRTLKRQASAARRYRQAEEEHRALLRQVLACRAAALLDHLAALEGRLTAAVDRDAGLAQQLSAAEATLAEGRQTADRLAARVGELFRRQAELAATIEGRQELLKATRRNLTETTERAAQGRALAQRRGEDAARHRTALEELDQRRVSLVTEFEAASHRVAHDRQRIAAAEEELGQAAAQVETLRRRLLDQAAEVGDLARREQQAVLELEKSNYRKSRLEQERDQLQAEARQGEEGLALAASRQQELEARVEEKVRLLAQLGKELEATLKREAEATQEKQRREEHLREERQRQRLLTELSQAYAQRRSRLMEALRAAGVAAPRFLDQESRAVAGWERCLDFFLAQLTDVVLLPPGESPLPLARTLSRGDVEARLLSPLTTAPTAWPVVEDDAVVLSLGEALGLPEELAVALPPNYLVESGESALRLAHRHPGVGFLSREGLWAQGGLVAVEARQAAPGVLERERELARLEEELPRVEAAVEAARGELARQVETRAGLAKDQHRHQGEHNQLRQEAAVGKARLDDLAHRFEVLQKQGRELAEEQKRLALELSQAEERRRGLEQERMAIEAGHRGLQEELDTAQQAVEAAKGHREALRTASAGERGRLELLEERLAGHDRERERLAREVAEAEHQVAAWQQEAERLDARRAELEATQTQAETELGAALEEQGRSADTVLSAQQELDQHKAGLAVLEERIAALRGERDGVRGEIEALRVERAGLSQDGAHLAATFREHFGERQAAAPPASAAGAEEEASEAVVSPATAEDAPGDDGGAAPEDPPESPAEPELPWPQVVARAAEDADPGARLPQLEAMLARSRATLERLGPVNVLAVDEYTAAEERHGFLTTQRADVADSVARLKATIREINETSSERFLATFTEVNRHFGETFTRLFRGGEAEMRLQDEEDVLETGIEIVARPPGKRLQNLMLLSGGEKALTAVALLFALFRTKPSPFCILDEVDAPLDDLNCQRFVELLQEMSRDTQFLVITHNKITMEAASTLYGVTMEEKGVSKLVAVEVGDLPPLEQRTA